MYEMYPDAWITADERRQTTTIGDRPRRRARKEHSVAPPIIARAVAGEVLSR